LAARFSINDFSGVFFALVFWMFFSFAMAFENYFGMCFRGFAVFYAVRYTALKVYLFRQYSIMFFANKMGVFLERF